MARLAARTASRRQSLGAGGSHGARHCRHRASERHRQLFQLLLKRKLGQLSADGMRLDNFVISIAFSLGLIPRFYDAVNGNILVDGVNVWD
jgi:hypothetical protein